MKIAMFGHKRVPSREGGVEVVVGELSTRMAAAGHQVICYNRGGRCVNGQGLVWKAVDEYKGVSLKRVFTLNKKGLAAVTSSFFAAVCSAFGRADVVHIHAEGPAFMCWLPKLFGKRIVVTVHGLDWQREKWRNGIGARYILAGERMAVRFADEIIVLSRNMQEYFKNTYGRSTVWIPNGVNQPEYAAADYITDFYGLKQDEYILFLVVWHKVKALFTKKPYSMYENKLVRDYRDGKVTKAELDRCSTCDLCADGEDGREWL